MLNSKEGAEVAPYQEILRYIQILKVWFLDRRTETFRDAFL